MKKQAGLRSRNRPRSAAAHRVILIAALDQAVRLGFRTLNIDGIAAAASDAAIRGLTPR